MRCPVCGSSTNKQFHRGAGLEMHLNTKHAAARDAASAGAAAWHAEQAAQADADGVSARRGAGTSSEPTGAESGQTKK